MNKKIYPLPIIAAIFFLLVATTIPRSSTGQNPTFRAQNTSPSPTPTPDWASDTFTESGSSFIDLNTHTPEVGGSWIHQPHANYTTEFRLDQSTDRIYAIGTSAYYINVTPTTADYEVEADFFLSSAISQNVAICGRMDTTADTMYCVRLNGGTAWEMRKIVAASASTIGTSSIGIPSVGSSSNGRFVLHGNQLSFYANGVQVISPITDSSITAAGRAGVRNSGAATSTTGIQLDNFKARY